MRMNLRCAALRLQVDGVEGTRALRGRRMGSYILVLLTPVSQPAWYLYGVRLCARMGLCLCVRTRCMCARDRVCGTYIPVPPVVVASPKVA